MFQIKDIPLFSKLDSESINKIKEDLLITDYQKDSIVFYEGDSSEYFHILISGSVRLYKTTHKGRQIYIHGLAAPSLIAEYPTFEKASFPATCEFVTEGTIGLLHYDKLYEYLKEPSFSLEIISSLTKKAMLLSNLLHKETILSSEEKVADLMLRDPMIFSRLKYNEISTVLNLTPETFSRILSKLKRDGIISITDHQLKILDQKALNRIMESNQYN